MLLELWVGVCHEIERAQVMINQNPHTPNIRPKGPLRSSPWGASFSTATTVDRSRMANRFMTPKTNSNAISVQQHPLQ